MLKKYNNAFAFPENNNFCFRKVREKDRYIREKAWMLHRLA